MADLHAEPEAPGPGLAWFPLAFLALEHLLVQLASLTQYGWFRDELYYLVCADHLGAGYVDHPPLSVWLLALWRAAFGESLGAVRLLPALTGSLTLWLAGTLTRALGGGRFAQVTAASAVFVAPVFLGLHHIVTMNSLDLLLWLLAFHALVRVLRSGANRDWLLLGLALGCGLLNKISVLWLIAGIGAGLLLTGHRRVLRTPGPWLAGVVALVLFSPYLAWQVANGWPTLEFMRNATRIKMAAGGVLDFWASQVFTMNPANLLVWLPGLAWLLAARDGRSWRPLGIVFVVVAAILLLAGRSRASYLTPAYLPLFAAGGIALERALATGWRRWLRAPVLVVIAVVGVAIAPFAIPVLPVERYVEYARALGLAAATEERHEMGPLPQHFADMFGWQELADEVARVYASLPEHERARCAIFGQNYGEAGAVTVLGRRHGLPPALSGHNHFWLWGPPREEPEVMIVIGGDEADNRAFFAELERAGIVDHPYAMPYERHLSIWIGRKPRQSLRGSWGMLKRYI